MKILEIKTANFEKGEQAHQITHQEGWDFRGTEIGKGYVRVSFDPDISEHHLYLRGESSIDDYSLLNGIIKWDKITEFFNGPDSPLDLGSDNQDKPHVSTITDKALHKAGFTDYCVDGGYIVDKKGETVIDLFIDACPFCFSTPLKLVKWVLEHYIFHEPKKKEVVMEIKTEYGFTVRTWTLKEVNK